MSVPAFLRHPAVLLTAVSAAIAFVWFALGWPVAMPRPPLAANEKLDCLSYQPFRPGQSPSDPGLVIAPAQIEQDLAKLNPFTSCVRTYTLGMGLDRVPEFARKSGLGVLVGLALGRDAERNRAEVERALAAARAHRPVIRGFVVGHEVLSSGDMPARELMAVIRRVRDETRLPVSYADTSDAWLKAPELLDVVTFVTINIRPYREKFPVAAAEAARRVSEVRTKAAERLRGKEIVVAEAGWPSAGRMREAALPSPANQALVIHNLAAAAKAGRFRIVIQEAFDQPWKLAAEGTAGAHYGLFDADNRAPKFRWGAAVTSHPLWFYQALLGVMQAFVTFAAGFLAARSLGPKQVLAADWLPVAGIALAGGLFVGWAVANAPRESLTIVDWIYSAIVLGLSIVTAPVAAAAAVRRTPFEGFPVLFDPLAWRGADPLARVVTALLALAVMVAIQRALGLVFDPEGRDFPFAPLTGPAAALFLLAWIAPRGRRRESIAEIAAALILGGAAIFIAFNETVWNWQALWFAAVLVLLAAGCLYARGERSP